MATQRRYTPYPTLPRTPMRPTMREAMPRLGSSSRFNPADMLGLNPFAGQSFSPYTQQVPSFMPPPGVMPPLFDQTPR